MLAPAETLDGFGLLSAPPQAATGLAADAFDTHAGLAAPSARAVRPGERAAGAEPRRRPRRRRRPAPPVPGAAWSNWPPTVPEQALGPSLLALAVLLLAIDLLIALGLRGLLRLRAAGAAMLLLAAVGRGPAHAAALETGIPIRRWRRGSATSSPATPRSTGSRRPGWRDCRTTSTGAPPRRWWSPIAVEPGKTDLSFYPLLYWPITADAQPLSPGGRLGAERLHEPRRHHPDRHARFRLGRGLRAGHRTRRCGGWRRGW